jgi:CTP:molybdopterin cytidylyltransferase MocA
VIAGVLLAAGGARRFGSQKLVATFAGAPLVRHAAEVLSRATDSLVVVVGRDADAVRASLRGIDAVTVENSDWSTGLASSIRCGVTAVPADSEAIVVALGDQPRIGSDVIERLIARWRESGVSIAAVRYRGQRGHPVLFDRSLFAEIAMLEGDVGARGLIDLSPDRVAYVDVDEPMPADVDTRGDLDALGSG